MGSPYNFAVALLLRLLVGPRADTIMMEDEEEEEDLALSAETIESLNDWLVDEVMALAHVPTVGRRLHFGMLMRRLSDEVSEEVASWLARRLEACRASPDAIVDVIEELKLVLDPNGAAPFEDASLNLRSTTRLDPKSVFGVYLRRTILACTESHFSAIARLYDRITIFLDEEEEQVFLEPQQLELYLEQNAERISTDISSGNSTYEEVEAELAWLLRLHPHLPRAHFLRYLNCAQHREFQRGLDSLHRYFDYAMSRASTVVAAPPAAPVAGRTADAAQPTPASSNKGLVQHAILNVAALHFRFGHRELGALAIDEAVRVAQQRRDHACVTYALSWLHHVMVLAEDDERNAEDVLRRCMSRSMELGLADLAAAARLTLARRAALSSSSVVSTDMVTTTCPVVARYQPSQADTSAVDALQVRQQQPSQPQSQPQQAEHFDTATSRRAAALGSQRHVVAAYVWALRGHHRLQISAARSLLLKAADGDEDAPTAVALELARCTLALGLLQGDSLARLKQHGHHTAFDLALRTLRSSSNAPLSLMTWHCGALLEQERALNSLCLDRAAALSGVLCGLSPRFSDLGCEAHVIAALRWLELVVARGAFARARNFLGMLLQWITQSSHRSSELRVHRVQALLLGARIELLSAPQCPVAALPNLLRCLSLCERYAMDAEHALTTMRLAEVHVRLGSLARAKSLARASLPKVLEHCSIEAQGDAWVLLADCELLQSSHHRSSISPSNLSTGSRGWTSQAAQAKSPHRTAGSLSDALKYLRLAIESYTFVQHITKLRKAYYLKSRICATIPGDAMLLERNEAAREFMQLNRLLFQNKEHDDTKKKKTPPLFDEVLG